MTKLLKTISRFGLSALLLIVSVSPALTQNTTAASPWFSGDPVVTSADKPITLQDLQEVRQDKNGPHPGETCAQKRIARRAFGTLGVQYEDSCWFSTKVGLISEGGNYLLQPGTSVAGHITNSSLDSRQWPIFYSTPNKDMLLELVPSPALDGYYLAFRHVDDMVFERIEHTTGTVTLKIQGEATYTPTFENVPLSSARHKVHLDQLWWSSDGNYMMEADRGTLWRYDLVNYKYVGITLAGNPGFRITSSAAITPSGKYGAFAVETSGLVTNLIIVDFDSCPDGGDATDPVSSPCVIGSFKGLLQEHTSFTNMLLPRFYGEDTLGVYLYDNALPENGVRQYFLQAFGTERVTNGYVALGDSFSSGEGAGDYIEGTDVKDMNMCHTSTNSYPYLINSRLNLSAFMSVACSGAVIENYSRSAQYDDRTRSITFPGASPQNVALKNSSSNIVTITMSGNDLGFSDKLKYCLVWSASCYNSYEERKEIANQIRSLHPDLVNLYGSIMYEDSPSRRKLFVVGYPQIMNGDADAECAANVNFSAYQRSMANDLINYFNAVIKSAADHAGAFYVDTESAFYGHRMCDGVSAFMGINGLTFGDETLIENIGPISNASYHPNELGHQLLSDRILELTGNFSTAMIEIPNTSTPIPVPDDYPFLDIPSSGDVIHKTLLERVVDNPVIQKGAGLILKYTNVFNPFLPRGFVTVLVKSDSVVLGQVQTDQLGMLGATLSLPQSIESGMHELQINGIGQDGQPLSIRQFLFIYADENDFDGDGINNIDEPCVMIDPAGVDADQDGIDDACDPIIDLSGSTDPPTPPDTSIRKTRLKSLIEHLFENVTQSVIKAYNVLNRVFNW